MFYCRSFLVLLVVLYFSIEASALKCNTCLGTKTSDCHNSKTSSMLTNTCSSRSNILAKAPFSLPYEDTKDEIIKYACIEVIIKLKTFSESASTRDCVGAPIGVDVCKILEIAGEVENCKTCSTDMCNNSTIT